MSNRNDLVWFAGFDETAQLYTPMRQYRRFCKADNSFNDKAKCQERCDRMNERYERPVYLITERHVQPADMTILE